MSYSEKQLLLLSNFVYLPCSVNDATVSEILDNYRDENGTFTLESVRGAGTGGGLTNQDVCTLFNEFDKEIQNDPDFGRLSGARKLNDGYVRAICYTNDQDEDPVVVFRGTGGSKEAWTDNFEGGYETDTKMQTLAADFVKNECSAYKNITVTGHSKGGNMSQYVTAMCGDMVCKCVSFDGQGFNKDFINKNKDKIEEAAPKIKSVSAYNDYVNILLTPIAGEMVYVDNENSIAAAHSSLAMLLSNTYDEKGNFNANRNQSTPIKCLDGLTDDLVKVIDELDIKDQKIISSVTGSTIATALEIGSLSDAVSTVAGLGQMLSAVLVQNLFEKGIIDSGSRLTLVTKSLKMETNAISSVSNIISSLIPKIREYRLAIVDIEDALAYNIASQIFVRRKLTSIVDSLLAIENNLNVLANSIKTISQRYESREVELVNGII